MLTDVIFWCVLVFIAAFLLVDRRGRGRFLVVGVHGRGYPRV
jgi:hypothetical protein